MSWSMSVSPVPVAELEAAVRAARDANPGQFESVGAQEQLEQATKAAKALAESGVVGNPAAHKFGVTLSGHANPNHEPTPGWGNDVVSISVYQRDD